MVNITGTLIWYYYICKREVWLMAHQIEPAQNNTNIEIGRIIHEDSYQREKKEIRFDNTVIDILGHREGNIIIAEIKKSSKYLPSVTKQLAFYLLQLKEKGINLTGEIRIPQEKKKIKVELTQELEQEIKEICVNIEKIIELSLPPVAEKIHFCGRCGYYEFCWC